jgi:hypothetical protein
VEYDDTRAAQQMDDDRLLDRLGDLFRRQDPPPDLAVELARRSFGLRAVDAELAMLVADPDNDLTAVAVRGDETGTEPRSLLFETGSSATGDGAAVEVEVEVVGRGRRLLGQLQPPRPARIEVRQVPAAAARWVDADEQGRFVIDALRPGPFSLTCHAAGRRPIVTDWTALH